MTIMLTEEYSIFGALLPLIASFYILSIISVRLQGPKAPLVGLKSIFEPRLVANFRFFKDSAAIINEGYSKANATARKCKPCH